jgi:hypothetical protein
MSRSEYFELCKERDAQRETVNKLAGQLDEERHKLIGLNERITLFHRQWMAEAEQNALRHS